MISDFIKVFESIFPPIISKLLPIWKQKYFTQNVAHIDEQDENTMESSGSVSADPDFTMDLKTGKISLLRLGMKKEEIGNHAKD